MSLPGEINKVAGELRRALENIALSPITGRDGALIGTSKVCGYVCKIHQDGELAGTIDVQEYNCLPGENGIKGLGHHEGVLLSAIQDNQNGFLVVPTLFSEVVIVNNPTDNREYVLMYSHADRIDLNTHKEVNISATEYEDFVETDNGLERDYNELEPTGNKSSTTYTPTSIKSQVVSPDDEKGLTDEATAAKKTLTVGDTSVTIDGQNVNIQTSGKVNIVIGGTSITQEDGKVTIKTDNAKIESTSCEIKADTAKIDTSSCEIKGNVTIKGGSLTTKGQSATDLQGPFNAIKVCPFSGAPHCGSSVSGT